jgi:hypothetical protein
MLPGFLETVILPALPFKIDSEKFTNLVDLSVALNEQTTSRKDCSSLFVDVVGVQLIETLANELDYVGFVHFSTLSNVSDEEFIQKFLHQESIQWIKENM